MPSPIALDLLEGPLGDELAGLLQLMPVSVSLWSDEAEALIAAGKPADIAWRALIRNDGIGWVTAGGAR